MTKCPRCGHQNLPDFPNCSACGTPLHGGAPATTGDEYARLMAQRAQAGQRNRKVIAIVVAAAVVVGGAIWYGDYKRKAQQQAKLNFFERWAELEKRETGSFFNCVMAAEIDMNMVSNAQQIQQKIEVAYLSQQKTFAGYLTSDCVPRIERARQEFGSLRDPPAEFVSALGRYTGALPKLQAGIEAYAEKVKGRSGLKDIDQLIQEHGNAWHSGSSPTPEAVAFEKFMHCAVPGLAKMKDVQEMLQHLAGVCFKKDAVGPFMDKVRNDCGPILTGAATSKPSPTWKVSQRFYEQDARQLRAWDDCAKKSRKGKKVDDLAGFLTAVGEYMEARTEVVKSARDVRESAR